MKSCRIVNETTGELVTANAEIADNLWSRFWGLMGRRQIADDHGLLIEPCSSIHTMFMRFTIDVVFMDRDRRILKVATVPPFRASLAGGTKSVLELRAGRSEELSLKVGQQLRIEQARNDAGLASP
jgi:uncharacterized membrane protein (UPF0127 family)